MRTLSLRGRLTAWYTLVLVVVFALFAGEVLVEQQHIGLRRMDREIDATHAQLANMMREELRELDSPRLAAEESRNVIASADRAIAILAADGTVLVSELDSLGLAGIIAGESPATGLRTVQARAGAWRVDVRRETLQGVGLLLVVASPMSHLARDRRDVREAMAFGIPIALALAAGGGLWIASVGLRPITAMARRAANIPLTGQDDLGPPARDDEIGQLTRAFNDLVSRLQSALRTQRQFMADASHELRTPVSIVRTAGEVALSRGHRDETEYREALALTTAQSRRLGTLVDDMLVLARADAGGYPLRPVHLYLDDVVDECRRAVDVLAAEHRITVTAAGASDVPILADEELLRRLLVNVLQNAVQHSPPGGVVSVSLTSNGPHAFVRVTDSGPGIADEDQSRIFDRFVQLDPSRRAAGTGLGLAIAKWIADAHAGSLTIEASGPRGTTFCLTWPVALRPQPPARSRLEEDIPGYTLWR